MNGSFAALLLKIGLTALTEKKDQKPTMFDGDLHSMILLNRPDKQIVQTTFKKGTEIFSFQSNELMILQVIRGKLSFHSHEGKVNLSPGEFLAVKEKKHYILTTGEETMFNITLFTGNQGQTDYIMKDNSETQWMTMRV